MSDTPTIETIGARLGISPGEVITLREQMADVLSLEAVEPEDLKDDGAEREFEWIARVDSSDRLVAAAKAALSQREWYALVSRFGLEDGGNRTLEEIGEVLDVTRERVKANPKPCARGLGPVWAGGMRVYSRGAGASVAGHESAWITRKGTDPTVGASDRR